MVAKYSSNPKQEHDQAIIYIVRYLIKTCDLGLHFKPDTSKCFYCYADADFSCEWNKEFAELDRNVILAAIINHFEINLEMWENDQSFLAQYRSASVTLGREVEVSLPGGEKISSRATDISNAGALMLEDGSEVTVGDVVHLR